MGRFLAWWLRLWSAATNIMLVSAIFCAVLDELGLSLRFLVAGCACGALQVELYFLHVAYASRIRRRRDSALAVDIASFALYNDADMM